MRRFRGSIVALPTPFRNGSIDFPALRGLIELQVAGGSDGLAVGGSTAEAGALSTSERIALIEFAAGVTRDRIPVLAGIGTSDTRGACELARRSEHAGADGLLATTPSYCRPTQEGLERHYDAIAGASALPIVVYNIPTRTGVDLLPETVERIAARNRSIVAIKEACDSLDRLHALVELQALDVLCGEDRWMADAMEMGAAGLIGVVNNLIPDRIAEIIHAFDDGNGSTRAPALVESIMPLVRALSLEPNPAPLKAALEKMGLCNGELRLPLVPVKPETRGRIDEAFAVAGLAE